MNSYSLPEIKFMPVLSSASTDEPFFDEVAEKTLSVTSATVTTIAPTGTISIIAGCSGGIELLFAVAFMRRQADMELPDVNPEFVKLARERASTPRN
jgi:ribonucleotide reductase alpha subunit